MPDFPSFGPLHQDPLHKTLEKCKNAIFSAISGNVSDKADKDKKDKKQPIYKEENDYLSDTSDPDLLEEKKSKDFFWG